MFTINKITLQNFLSYGNQPTEFDFDVSDSILISGASGNGKSAIPEALFFAITGKPYRKTTKNGLINKFTQKNTKVELYCTSNNSKIKIVRGIRPNVLEIYKNGELLKEGVSKKEFQKELENTIGFNENIFKQFGFIDNTFYKPFMDLTPYEKRVLIDKIFNVNKLNDMFKLNRTLRAKNKTKQEELNHKFELIDQKIKMTKTFNQQLIENNNNKYETEINEHNNQLEKNNKTIKELLSIVNEKKLLKKDSSTLQKDISNLKQEINNFNFKIKDAEKTIKYFDTENHCKLCKQEITEDTKKEHINSHKEFISDYKEKIESNEKIINEKVKELKIITDFNTELKSELSNYVSKINENKSINKNLKKIINNIIQKQEELKNKLIKEDTSEFEDEKNKITKSINKEKSIANIINNAADVLFDNGVRIFIIDKYLNRINKYIKEYLEYFDLQIPFELDSNFNQVELAEKRLSIDYSNMSSGQKLRVNFSTLFAFINFLENKHDQKLGFLILDEALSSSADADTKDAFLNIIKHKMNKKIILISHDIAIQNEFDTVYKVEKKGNFSTIELESN